MSLPSTIDELKDLDKYPDIKLFAVLDPDHIVVDAVLNYTIEEAQQKNPGKIIVQMFLENSPLEIGQKMEDVDKWLSLQSSLMA